MNLIHSDQPYPNAFSSMPLGNFIEREFNVKVTKKSRLSAKVIVFDVQEKFIKFWNKNIRHGDLLGQNCMGAVNSLMVERLKIDDSENVIESAIIADPSYFCVMGFVSSEMTMEIISHESVHAGIAYAKRVGKMSPFYEWGGLDEESVCYPSGIIASELNRNFHKFGLYK